MGIQKWLYKYFIFGRDLIELSYSETVPETVIGPDSIINNFINISLIFFKSRNPKLILGKNIL